MPVQEPSPSTTVPSWVGRSIIACLVLGVAFAAATLALAASGGPAMRAPLNSIVLMSLGGCVLGLVVRRSVGQVIDHINRSEARTGRRFDQLASGMTQHGIQLDAIANTGEIPRVRVTACAHDPEDYIGYARGYADAKNGGAPLSLHPAAPVSPFRHRP